MPSELARRHQADAGVLADDTADRIRRAARRADVADIDRWWDRTGPGLTRTVARASAAASTLAGRYLVAEAAANGVIGLEPVLAVVDLAQIATALRVTGPVGFKRHIARTGDPDRARLVMADRMAASTDRLTMAGSRQTIADTADTSPLIRRYRRIAQAGACDFCSMLAGRGHVYRSEASAGSVVGRRGRPRGTRRVGQSYHDGCRCHLELGWVTA